VDSKRIAARRADIFDYLLDSIPQSFSTFNRPPRSHTPNDDSQRDVLGGTDWVCDGWLHYCLVLDA